MAANFDLQDERTALISATNRGHADCVRLLIDAGADKEARDHVRILCLLCNGSVAIFTSAGFCDSHLCRVLETSIAAADIFVPFLDFDHFCFVQLSAFNLFSRFVLSFSFRTYLSCCEPASGPVLPS